MSIEVFVFAWLIAGFLTYMYSVYVVSIPLQDKQPPSIGVPEFIIMILIWPLYFVLSVAAHLAVVFKR